jgi:hypothetical protein
MVILAGTAAVKVELVEVEELPQSIASPNLKGSRHRAGGAALVVALLADAARKNRAITRVAPPHRLRVIPVARFLMAR